MLLGLVLSRPAAAATDEEKAGARAAAMEGLAAYNEKRWAEVLDLFTRAEELVHSPMHLLYIGRAHVELGNMVRAQEALMKASRQKLDPDSPPAFERARDTAAEELKALEPRIPYITLKLEGATRDAVTVTMDGDKIPSALVGVRRPVDPGNHTFEASGPGVQATPVTVSVSEAEKKEAVLVVKIDQAAAAAAAAKKENPAGSDKATGAAAGAGGPPGQDEGPAEEGPNALRIASYSALGVGALGFGLGIGFGLKANSKRDEANSLCDSRGCPESQKDAINAADSAANSASTMAVVGFVLGGVGLAAGATLFVLSTPKEKPPNAAFVRPWIGVGSAGVSGRF